QRVQAGYRSVLRIIRNPVSHAFAVADDVEKTLGALDGGFARRKFQHRKAADQLLRFGIRTVDHDAPAVGAAHYAPVLPDRQEAAARQHFAALPRFRHERVYFLLSLAGRPPRVGVWIGNIDTEILHGFALRSDPEKPGSRPAWDTGFAVSFNVWRRNRKAGLR